MLARLAHHAALAALSLVTLVASAQADTRASAEPTTAAKKASAPSAKALLIKLDTTALKLKRDEMRQRYLQGKQHVRFGQYDVALKAFREVYRREGLADVLFDMAECEARLGHMPAALSLHRRYVSSFKKPLDRLVAAARFGSIVKRIKKNEQRAKSAAAPVAAPAGRAPSARNRP